MSKTCVNCRFYDPIPDAKQGVCHGNPPTIVEASGGFEMMRPEVYGADIACRHHHQPPRARDRSDEANELTAATKALDVIQHRLRGVEETPLGHTEIYAMIHAIDVARGRA